MTPGAGGHRTKPGRPPTRKRPGFRPGVPSHAPAGRPVRRA
jgi:hypothetical protein